MHGNVGIKDFDSSRSKDDGGVRADASLPWFHFLPRLLQFTVDELFHCSASKNTWTWTRHCAARWCGACETIALAAIKVLHCTGGVGAGGIPATHVSEAPMLLYLLLPLLPVCNPSQEYGFLLRPSHENFPCLLSLKCMWDVC